MEKVKSKPIRSEESYLRQQLIYLVQSGETRTLNLSAWVVIIVAFINPFQINLLFYVAVWFVIHHFEMKKSKRVRPQIHELILRLAGKPRYLKSAVTHFKTLPSKERTLQTLDTITSGEGLATDGLNCFQRAKHVIGCTHWRLPA